MSLLSSDVHKVLEGEKQPKLKFREFIAFFFLFNLHFLSGCKTQSM